MAKSSPILNSFNSGELSPRMAGRTDFAKYANGCETLENFVLYPHGGAVFRPGTYYVAEVKDSSKEVRLVDFEFSRTQAYVLEFGDQYIRFYKDKGQILSGGVAYEIVSPYIEADLSGLKFAQSADVLYIVHADYAPRKLTRTAHTSWTLTQITFVPPPTSVQDVYPATTLTMGSTSGEHVTFTVGAAYFLAGDVDREIISGSGRAIITGASGGGAKVICEGNIIDAFSSLGPIAANSWSLRGSPTGSNDPSKTGPKNASVTMTNSLEAFRTDDVGKYVAIHDGLIKITSYASDTIVTGQILKILDAETATTSWTMEGQDWDATLGYPEAVCFHGGRLWFGRDVWVWGSVVEDYENFTASSDDDASVKRPLLANEVNEIRWLDVGKNLVAGTVGGEWTVRSASTSDPITPSTIDAGRETTHGCADVTPIVIGQNILYVQRAGRKLRELAYNFESDGFRAPDLTILAEHITEGGIIDLAYQEEPNSVVWAVRADGVLLGLTYDRMHDVIGWHRHPMDGGVESITVIPGTGEEYELWMVVKYTIDGSTKRYIQYMKPFDWGSDQEDCFFLDCGLTYDSTAATTITGLSHLEGETVGVLADGAVHPDCVVASGEITLSRSASVVQVGLKYTGTLKTMKLATGSATGTAQGKLKKITRLTARFLDTLGGKIGSSASRLETIYFRGSDPMNAPPPLFTGDKEIVFPQGYNVDGQVVIVQDQPLPMTVLAVMAEVQTSDER